MPATAYTRSSLTAELLNWAHDPNGVYYEHAQVYGWINDVMAEWCARVQSRRHTWSLDMVADQTIYSLLSLTPRAIDIQLNSWPTSAGSEQSMAREPVSMEKLERMYPTWQTMPSTWPQVYARFTEGHGGFIVVPAPSSSQTAEVNGGTFADSPYGGVDDIEFLGATEATLAFGDVDDAQFLVGAFRIDGIAHSTDLTAGSDSLETVGGIDVQYQAAIKAGVKALMCDSDVAIAQAAKGPGYRAEFDAWVEKAQRLVKSSFQSKPAQSQRGSNI